MWKKLLSSEMNVKCMWFLYNVHIIICHASDIKYKH